MRQGKDTAVIGYRQEVTDPCFHPFLPGNIITPCFNRVSIYFSSPEMGPSAARLNVTTKITGEIRFILNVGIFLYIALFGPGKEVIGLF